MGIITVICSGDLIRLNCGLKDIKATLDARRGEGKHFFIDLVTTEKSVLIYQTNFVMRISIER
jgi:hypothetical protein